MAEGRNNETPLGRYFGWYTVILLGFYVVLAIVQTFVNVSTTGVSMIAPFLGAMFAAEIFLKRERRLPDPVERHQLTMGSLGIFVFLNTGFLLIGIMGGVAEAAGVTRQNFMIMFVSILIAAVALNYLLLRWAYGGALKKRAEKLGISLPPDYDRDN